MQCLWRVLDDRLSPLLFRLLSLLCFISWMELVRCLQVSFLRQEHSLRLFYFSFSAVLTARSLIIYIFMSFERARAQGGRHRRTLYYTNTCNPLCVYLCMLQCERLARETLPEKAEVGREEDGGEGGVLGGQMLKMSGEIKRARKKRRLEKQKTTIWRGVTLMNTRWR